MVMKDFEISLVYLTYRPGGFDLLADCLKRQIYKNWELVVVDDYPGRDVSSYLTEQGLPLSHYTDSKKKCYRDAPFGQVNAMNTGLLHASGELVVFMHDYQWIPGNALGRWNIYYQDKMKTTLASGVGIEVSYRGGFKTGNISIFDPPFNGWQPYVEPALSRFYRSAVSGGGIWNPGVSNPNDPPFENFYAAFPMEYLDNVNGFDEREDYNHQFPLYGNVRQAELNGYKVTVDGDNIIYYLMHRGWQLDDPKLWHVVKVAKNTKYHGGVVWEKISPNNFDVKSERPKRKIAAYSGSNLVKDITIRRAWGDLTFSHDTAFVDDKYESEIFELFDKSIKDTDVILDIGAHQGLYATYFASLAKNGKVYSFEPHPTNYKYLVLNTSRLSNVVAVNKAVGNENGKTILRTWSYDNPDRFSGRHSFTTELGGDIPIEVDTVKLDTFVKENNTVVNFIKMDVEGWEWEVVKGADNLIRIQKPKMIIEIHTALCQSNLEEYFNSCNMLYRMIRSGIPDIGHVASYMVVNF
jgi:FkbM family methyltransferase